MLEESVVSSILYIRCNVLTCCQVSARVRKVAIFFYVSMCSLLFTLSITRIGSSELDSHPAKWKASKHSTTIKVDNINCSFVTRRGHWMLIATFRLLTASLLQAKKF